jgi:hypothetical protein
MEQVSTEKKKESVSENTININSLLIVHDTFKQWVQSAENKCQENWIKYF